MPAILVFIAFFALALLGGAISSYPVYLLLTNWFELDFQRVVSRCVLVIAIILFIALFRRFGFNSWHEIGFNLNRMLFWKRLLKGFGTGILIMFPVIAGLLISHNRVIDPDWDWSFNGLSLLLVMATITGLLVGLIEETLFRGAMLNAIQRYNSALFAVVTTSFIYAFIHFLRPEIHLDASTLDWSSGFAVVNNAFLALLHPIQIVDSFIALFLAGMLLAIINVRGNQLATCIGIHAGWVFTIKVFKRATDSNTSSEYAYLAGNYDNVIGYLAAVCIALTIVIYLGMRKRTPSH